MDILEPTLNDAYAQENLKNLGKNLKDQSARSGRVKLGVLAKSNISASTPLRKADLLEEKELLKSSGDDFHQFIKSTTSKQPRKASDNNHYPPVEYGYCTNMKHHYEDEVFISDPPSGIIWERDEEDEAHEISDSELEDILQSI